MASVKSEGNVRDVEPVDGDNGGGGGSGFRITIGRQKHGAINSNSGSGSGPRKRHIVQRGASSTAAAVAAATSTSTTPTPPVTKQRTATAAAAAAARLRRRRLEIRPKGASRARPGPYKGPLQPHRPRRSNRAPAADRKPVTAFVNYTGTAFGQQPTSERINAPGYTFGDPTISTVDKRDRQVELMQAADAGDVYAERPQSPRLSERFPAPPMSSTTTASYIDPPSSFGPQNESAAPSAPRFGFGSCSRDHRGPFYEDKVAERLPHLAQLRAEEELAEVRAQQYWLAPSQPNGADGGGGRDADIDLSILTRNAKRLLILRRNREKTAPSPGPGEYHSDPGGFAHLGGGASASFSLSSQPTPTVFRFGKAPRDKVAGAPTSNDSPGPGTYNVEFPLGGYNPNSSFTNPPSVKLGSEDRSGGYDALNMAPENTGPGPGAYFRDALPSLVSHASTLASAMVATTSRHSGSGLGASGAQGIAAQHVRRSPRRRLTQQQQQQQQQHKARRQQSQMHHSSVLLSLSTASEIPPAAGGLGIGARAVPSTVQTTPVVEFGLARRANQHVYMPHADAGRGSGGRPRPPPALCA